MAEKKFEKGSEEWEFFQDLWKFRQKYYTPDNDDAWVVEMMRHGETIIEKYKNTNFSNFAQGLIFECFTDIDRKIMKGKNNARSNTASKNNAL